MTIFSEESKLLMKNWDSVDAILNAEKALRHQLTEFLTSIEDYLKKTDWWGNKWEFIPVSNSEVSIAKSTWSVCEDQDGTTYGITIGIENFNPENLFGNELAPILYVWGGKNQGKLVEILREQLKTDKMVKPDELDNKGRGTYIVKRSLPQHLPEMKGNFVAVTRKQIIDHFSRYAHIISKYDKLIQKNKNNLSKQTRGCIQAEVDSPPRE